MLFRSGGKTFFFCSAVCEPSISQRFMSDILDDFDACGCDRLCLARKTNALRLARNLALKGSGPRVNSFRGRKLQDVGGGGATAWIQAGDHLRRGRSTVSLGAFRNACHGRLGHRHCHVKKVMSKHLALKDVDRCESYETPVECC